MWSACCGADVEGTDCGGGNEGGGGIGGGGEGVVALVVATVTVWLPTTRSVGCRNGSRRRNGS